MGTDCVSQVDEGEPVMNKGGKSVLYLTYDGLTDPLGRSQILPYLCGLSAMGYDITIISFEKPARLAPGKSAVLELCNQHQLRWEPLTYHKYPPVLSAVYDLLCLRIRAFRLFREYNFSVVHCRSYMTALVGLAMKKRFRLKFIFDMRGFWADERVEGGLWNLSNPLYKWVYRYFKRKEKEFVRETDRVIVLTANAEAEILGWGLSRSITTIPCCVDVDLFDPTRVDPVKAALLRKELGIRDGEFVLLYLGSIGTWYMMDEMLRFFSELKKERPAARFLIVTQDSVDLSGRKHAQDILVRKSSREDVPLFISLSDGVIMFIKPTFSKKGSSATKMAEVLSMGKPVLTNRGWGDIDSMMKWLPGLTALPVQGDYPSVVKLWPGTSNAGEIRAAAIENFSLSRGVQLYLSVYQDLI